LFVDPRILTSEGDFQLSQGDETDVTRIEVLTLNGEFGEKKEYREVMALYEKQALRDLSQGDIPAGMETVVKDYFIKINQ